MEKVLCLSLLLFSLSGAEIIEQRQDAPESVNVPEPRPCLSDLHAVLRELSVKLAKHEVKMEQLQTLNQEQNTKLARNEVRIEELQTLNQEQAGKLKGLESRVDARQQVGQVAFSASLLESGAGYTGPIKAHTTLLFKHVLSNIGSAYSPHTGLFTAPLRGAYHFEFYILEHGGAHASGVVLVKNGEHTFMAGEHQTNGHGTAANGATLLLEAGDAVFLRLFENHRVYDNGNRHCTFSGHLLFPM